MVSQSKAPEKVRIQKFLSMAGIASRRKAEELIEQGRVKISGKVVTEKGVLVIPGKSRVEVDNKPVFYQEERNYILFHKPTGCITSLDDPEKRTTVIDLLPRSLPRVFPVGRLDWDTEGLLVLTNDGDLAYKLMHPASNVPRVYHAKVRGELKDNSPELKRLKDGVELEDGFAKPDRVSVLKFTGNNTWVEIELHIGRNRIVRRLFEAIQYPVMKLCRVGFGNLTLDGLPLGAYRDLTENEVRDLYSQLGQEGDLPPQRSKSGVRYADGFKPSERVHVRQSAPQRRTRNRDEATDIEEPRRMSFNVSERKSRSGGKFTAEHKKRFESRFSDDHKSEFKKHRAPIGEASESFEFFSDAVSPKMAQLRASLIDDELSEFSEERESSRPRRERKMGRPRPWEEKQSDHSDRKFSRDHSDRSDRKFSSDRSDRKFSSDRSDRKFSGDRSDRKFSGDRSDRKFSSDRSDRKFSGDRSDRKFSGDRSDRKFSSDRSDRKFSSDRSDRSDRKFSGDRSGRKSGGNRSQFSAGRGGTGAKGRKRV